MGQLNISNHPKRLDANETAFLERQLVQVKRKSYDVKYKALRAASLIPVNTETPSGTKYIDWTSFSRIGQAKIISNYSKDFPRTDIAVEEKRAYVKGIGDSFGYNIPEIRAAANANPPLPLNQKRANNAMDIVNRKIDDIAWSGDTEYKLQGFIDFPGIQEYTVPADGTGSSKKWIDKTPDQIVRDVSGLFTTVISGTNRVEEPDSLLLPSDQFEYINSTRMTDGDSTTIMQFIMKNNVHVKAIEWVLELEGAGAGSTDRMMAYPRDPDIVELNIPQPVEMFEADKEGMEYVVPVHAETAGIICFYPLAIAFGDGI
jgi:hypothetical protein